MWNNVEYTCQFYQIHRTLFALWWGLNRFLDVLQWLQNKFQLFWPFQSNSFYIVESIMWNNVESTCQFYHIWQPVKRRVRFLLLERLAHFNFERFWFKKDSSKIKRIVKCFACGALNVTIEQSFQFGKIPIGVSDSKKLTSYSRKAVQKNSNLVEGPKCDKIFFKLIFYLYEIGLSKL